MYMGKTVSQLLNPTLLLDFNQKKKKCYIKWQRNKLLPVWKRYSTHQVIQVKTRQLSPCPSQEQVGFLKPEKQRNPIENEQEKNKASLARTQNDTYLPTMS